MRLLIVEDEPDMLDALAKGLQRDGYATDVAPTGEVAQELIEINEYDLIVLDINLPDTDGLTILKELREHNPDTRVIIVSANRATEDRIRGLDLGANDYLVKPFDFQELKARIRALLRRDFSSIPNILQEGGLELDMSTHRVLYKKHEIILTLKEYAILKYFIQNKERIISTEELFQHVWDERANPFSDVIRVHIYSLRKKLKTASGKSDIITTIKGAGYFFKI